MGYHLAGFEVVGVDIEPQPRYPFEFIQDDALDVLADRAFLSRFDAVHASPPCGAETAGAARWGTSDNHPRLIEPTRDLLTAWGGPWVIENVEPARYRLRAPLLLCGTMFGLGVFRHRLFEFSPDMPLLATPAHPRHRGRIGDGRFVTVTGKPGGSSKRDGIQHGDVAAWRRAMGIDWMTYDELAQAIPPAFTAFVGEQLYAQSVAVRAA